VVEIIWFGLSILANHNDSFNHIPIFKDVHVTRQIGPTPMTS